MYIAEPLAEGAFFELTRMVDDETEVRAGAQAALARAADAGLERATTVDYDAPLTIAGAAGSARTGRGRRPGTGRTGSTSCPPSSPRGSSASGSPATAPASGCFLHPMRADVLRPAIS